MGEQEKHLEWGDWWGYPESRWRRWGKGTRKETQQEQRYASADVLNQAVNLVYWRYLKIQVRKIWSYIILTLFFFSGSVWRRAGLKIAPGTVIKHPSNNFKEKVKSRFSYNIWQTLIHNIDVPIRNHFVY